MEPKFSIGDTVEVIDVRGGGKLGAHHVVLGISGAAMRLDSWYYTLDWRAGFGLFERRLKLVPTEIPYDPTQQGETDTDI